MTVPKRKGSVARFAGRFRLTQNAAMVKVKSTHAHNRAKAGNITFREKRFSSAQKARTGLATGGLTSMAMNEAGPVSLVAGPIRPWGEL